MKSIKLLAASLLAFAIVGTAFAANVALTSPVYIRVIGSTAFRAAYHAAVEDAMGGAGNYTVCYDGSDDAHKKFNAAIFYGTIAGHECVVKTYWTGSIAGIIELAQGEDLGAVFPDDSVIVGNAIGSATLLAAGYAKDANHVATVAMADNPVSEAAAILATAAVSASKTNAQTAIASCVFQDAGLAGEGGPNQTGVGVALVDFEWVLGASGNVPPVALNNMTQQNAAALIKTGYLSLAAFTGNPADNINYVFLVGRNEDSGTRNEAFAEAQTGFGQNCVQALITGNPVSAIAKYTNVGMNLEPLITWNALGHSGYNSGGNVATALSNVVTNPIAAGVVNANIRPPANATHFVAGTSKCYTVGYLGISNVSGVTGGKVLNYNGVPFSETNVQNGTYTFWNYEHNYYLTTAFNGNPISFGDTGSTQAAGSSQAVADAIADELYQTDAEFPVPGGPGPSGTFLNGLLLVKRAGAGAPVVFK